MIGKCLSAYWVLSIKNPGAAWSSHKAFWAAGPVLDAETSAAEAARRQAVLCLMTWANPKQAPLMQKQDGMPRAFPWPAQLPL